MVFCITKPKLIRTHCYALRTELARLPNGNHQTSPMFDEGQVQGGGGFLYYQAEAYSPTLFADISH